MEPVSTASKPIPEVRLGWRACLLLAGATILSVSAYLVASALTYRLGFPLDDSWIHQTYARNLALLGEWAFIPGQPSAGSTSPLWSLLLTPGFWLHISPYIWTYLLGTVLLWALAVLCELTLQRIVPAYRGRVPWVGLVVVAEWHLVWSAVSGMETLLHALILTGILAALMTGSRRYLSLGLLTGISVWVRPDGLTLLAPLALTALLVEKTHLSRLKALLRILVGFGAFFGPYLLFNLILSGNPMPNTFYAKQTEYALWQARPVAVRLGRLLLQWAIGSGVLLLPGVIGWVILSARRRAWGTLAGMLWFLGYITLYALRLPIYQHGRYVIPAMPVFFIWGLAGLISFVLYGDYVRAAKSARYRWAVSTAWQIALGLTLVSFWALGARAYGQDVALIESEMVTTANWVAEHVPPGDLVAAHDIGALGYFGDHKLLDLAGLVSPEVISFMRDEDQLAAYLDQRGADYLVCFPDSYPHLAQLGTPVFVTGSRFTLAMGAQNMVVYRWKLP
jgi:hypothetical protein